MPVRQVARTLGHPVRRIAHQLTHARRSTPAITSLLANVCRRQWEVKPVSLASIRIGSNLSRARAARPLAGCGTPHRSHPLCPGFGFGSQAAEGRESNRVQADVPPLCDFRPVFGYQDVLMLEVDLPPADRMLLPGPYACVDRNIERWEVVRAATANDGAQLGFFVLVEKAGPAIPFWFSRRWSE